MRSILTNLKSWYAKSCALVAVLTWILFFGYSSLGSIVGTLATITGLSKDRSWSLVLVISGLALAYLCHLLWTKGLGHLEINEVVGSTKVTIGISILTLGLLAFPGTLVVPLVYASLSGDSDAAAGAYLSLIGFPIGALLSFPGLALIFTGGNTRSAA